MVLCIMASFVVRRVGRSVQPENLQNQALGLLLLRLAIHRPVGVKHGPGNSVSVVRHVVSCDGHSTHLMALSNTDLRFICVRAEHSTYLYALISLARATPISYVMGLILLAASRAFVSSSSRMSSLVPTRMIGMLGA